MACGFFMRRTPALSDGGTPIPKTNLSGFWREACMAFTLAGPQERRSTLGSVWCSQIQPSAGTRLVRAKSHE
jgi:hypothetical protein